MKELIKKLVEVTGPSGFEHNVRDLILNEVKDYVDEYKVDNLGNLIVKKGNKDPKGKRIMLAAHMDEIGVIVTHIDENGFARFHTIGGVMERNCAGGRVRFINGVGGVIGAEPGGTRHAMPDISKMYIDTGAKTKADSKVKLGDVGAFERSFMDLGDRFVSKAIDDRIGCAVLIELMKTLPDGPNEIYGVFTTQEEVGLRGATASAFSVDPDLGISIDVTLVGDTPKANVMEVSLGKGPAIKIKDGGMISDPKVVAWMEKAAKRIKIPYQFEILLGGTTDAKSMQVNREGVPVGCISIPCRYVHSPSEMADYSDVSNAIKLFIELLKKPVKLD